MNNPNDPIVLGNEFDQPKKPKRKNKKTLWIILCSVIGFFILVAALGGNSEDGSESDSTGTLSNEVHNEEPTSEPEFEMMFFLTAGIQGEYGETITYNEGTEFEESFFAYYVPYGKYMVKNVGDYPTQVNAYSDEITMSSSGFEEPAECSVITLKVGETKELTVPEGWHIEITEPTMIQMQKVNEETSAPIPDEEIVSYKVVDTYYRFGRLKSNSMHVWLACFSIVENDGNTDLYLSGGEFTIKNKDGVLVARKSVVDVYPTVIAPGERGVYYCELDFYHGEFTTESYNFSITPEFNIKKSKIESVKLEVSDVKVKKDTFGDIHSIGVVENTTGEIQELYYVVTFLYDDADKMIGILVDMPDSLNVGDKIRFESSNALSYNVIDINDVDHYETIAFPWALNIE